MALRFDGSNDGRPEDKLDDEELHNWPLIPSSVPGKRLNPFELLMRTGVVEDIITYIRSQVDRLGKELDVDPDCADPEKSVPFRFLVDVMLPNAQTPRQMETTAYGYLTYCMRECLKGERRHSVLDRLRETDYYDRVHVIDMSCFWPKKKRILEEKFGPQKWKSLTEHSRHPIVETVSHGFSEDSINRYGGEPFYDGLYFLLADPTAIHHDGMPEDDNLVERKTPQSKRMTGEKLARFLQLPGLDEFVRADWCMAGPAIGSSLAIIAEYFCENDSAIHVNSIDTKMVEKWIREKFERYSPRLEVAYYVWARFQQTEFESTATFIEDYICKWLADHEPWVFEVAGSTGGDVAAKPGHTFKMFVDAIQHFKEGDPDAPQYQRLLQIIPGREIVQIFTKSKTAEYREAADYYLKNTTIHPLHFCRDYNQEGFRQDADGWMISLFNDRGFELNGWTANEGFELLDPLAIRGLSSSWRAWGLNCLKDRILKQIDKLPIDALFLFRNKVISQIRDPRVRKGLEEFIQPLIDKAYIASVAAVTSRETLIEIARGKDFDAGVLIPEVGNLPPEMRRAPNRRELADMAEEALIVKEFKGVRGEDAIIKFLLAHRHSMRVADLISPFPDAPNLEIKKRFAESPNLLLFLAMSTIMMYLGYSYDEILLKITQLAEQSASEERDECVTVGLEWEQVAGQKERPILTDNFSELFNVLPQGNDISCNEILTHPSTGITAQKALIDLITNPRHGYLQAGEMWNQQAGVGQPLSSLHVNMGIQDDIRLPTTQIRGYTAPLMRIANMIHGGSYTDSGNEGFLGGGRVREWAHHSFLDTIGDKRGDIKIECRTTALEPNGSHNDEIEQLLLIASACMQYAKDANGIGTTTRGKVMAQIFDEFSREVELLRLTVNPTVEARRLIATYAGKVKEELGL